MKKIKTQKTIQKVSNHFENFEKIKKINLRKIVKNFVGEVHQSLSGKQEIMLVEKIWKTLEKKSTWKVRKMRKLPPVPALTPKTFQRDLLRSNFTVSQFPKIFSKQILSRRIHKKIKVFKSRESKTSITCDHFSKESQSTTGLPLGAPTPPICTTLRACAWVATWRTGKRKLPTLREIVD